MKKRFQSKLPKPKITLDRIGQVIFTIREVTKLALRTKPKLLIAVFFLNAIWGFLAVPGFYLEKLIIDELVGAVGEANWQPIVISIGILVTIALALSLFRNFLGSFNGFLRRSVSRYFDAELTILLGSKLAQLDMATIENPDFQDKFNKIEKESGQRAWGLMMPLSDIPNYLVGFISSVGVLILLHPMIAVGVFVFSLPQLFINSKYIKKGYELSTALSPLRRMQGWLQHFLVSNRNFMELKILNLTDFLAKRLRKVANEIVERQIALSRKRELSRFGSFLPLTFYELVVSLFLIFWVIVAKITIGSFQLYLRSLRSAEQNLTGLVSAILEIYENYI
ncbi:hypothetical protein KKB40_03925, partial [Patescibacteria group bacterium]|nr:hypothetical protein [Patescibacteria group bacterium]